MLKPATKDPVAKESIKWKNLMPPFMMRRPAWLVLPVWWDTVMPMSMMARAFTKPDVKQRMLEIMTKLL